MRTPMILFSSKPSRQTGQRGSAVVILIMLLGIMAMYIAGNAFALSHLKREILLAEKKQERARVERLKHLVRGKDGDHLKAAVHGQNPHD